MRVLLLIGLILLPLFTWGRVDVYHFDDPRQEARYKQLIEELRCLVCQNQNLADSNAELAQDMRRVTYEMVARGDSNEKIITHMVERYGDFVLYRPPFQSSTLLLWVGPFLILAIAMSILLLFIRRRSKAQLEPLDKDSHERARRLLEDNDR